MQHTLGDPAAEQAIFEQVGSLYEVLGFADQAIVCWQHGSALAQQADDRAHVALALTCLQPLCADVGMTNEALAYHEQAMAGNTRALLDEGLLVLADSILSYGAIQPAADLYAQIAEHTRNTGSTSAEMHARGRLGMAYAAMGQNEKAAAAFARSAELARSTGDREQELWNLEAGCCGNRAGAVEASD